MSNDAMPFVNLVLGQSEVFRMSDARTIITGEWGSIAVFVPGDFALRPSGIAMR
jgi:hypothetical protein